MHPSFARKRLETALLAAGIADDAAEARDCTAPDCLAGLAVLLGNRASNGVVGGVLRVRVSRRGAERGEADDAPAGADRAWWAR